MRTHEIIAIAKEKLGKDISPQDIQDYMDGKISLPDEALELVSGGGVCSDDICPNCNKKITLRRKLDKHGCYIDYCNLCGFEWTNVKGNYFF